MRVTAELSLYPLEREYLPRIVAAIGRLRDASGVDVTVNQMSTQLNGELADVMRAIETMLADAFADGVPQALVAKVLNADLPIRDAPEV